MMSEVDILFLNATVVDGTGNVPRFRGSLLVANGLISNLKHGSNPYSAEELQTFRQSKVRIVDCEDGCWTLAPGFIDMHAHSDLSLLHTPSHEAKITQGVTTEVIGQDGISYSPVNETTMDRVRQQISGWNGNPCDPPDFFDRWKTVGQYLDVLDQERIATNAAYLVPQGNLRMLVKGWDSSPATDDEIESMKTLLAESLKEGAVGMSSGLTYVPGMFANDAELAKLCEVVKQHNGYYCPHTRSYGKGAMEAYAEMIELARKTGVRLHLTHAVLNFEENAGRANEFIEMIDVALASGLEISLDSYPYLPGSTTLSSTLPSWAASADDKLAILEDPTQLARVKHEALVQGTDGYHGCILKWNELEISGVQNSSLAAAFVGKTIDQIANERRQDPFDTYVEILKLDDFNSTVLLHCGHEDNVRKVMRHSRHTGSTDGILTSTKPHPRGWGTFPRYLGHYARDLEAGKCRDIYHAESSNVFEKVEAETIFAGGLEEAVAHLTSRPASVIGLHDRGQIKEGYRADLVLFSADDIRDTATYAHPKQAAHGIRSVLVNGVFAVDEGRPTGARAGRTIRLREGGRSGWTVK